MRLIVVLLYVLFFFILNHSGVAQGQMAIEDSVASISFQVDLTGDYQKQIEKSIKEITSSIPAKEDSWLIIDGAEYGINYTKPNYNLTCKTDTSVDLKTTRISVIRSAVLVHAYKLITGQSLPSS